MRSTRRRLFRCFALACTLALFVAACGGGAEATTAQRGKATGEPKPGPGFDGTTIRVGLVTPLSGPAGLIGTPLANGHRVYFDYVNQELGGIAGKYQLELVAEDDGGVPARSAEAYERIKGDVVMIADFLATVNVNAVLPQLKKDNIVAGTVARDSAFLREQQILTIGAPYEIETINALSYWQRHGGKGQRACVAYRDDPYYKASANAANFAANKLGFKLSKKVAFPPGNQDWTTQINELQGCQMVFLAASNPEASGILAAAAKAQFAPRWIGQSPSWASILPTLVGAEYLQEHFWLAAYGPDWGDQSVRGMAQMLQHVQHYAPDQQPNPVFTFGYEQAWAVHQVLEQAAKRGDLSRRGIIKAMNSIKTLRFGGLMGDYHYGPPQDRNPPRGSTIFAVDPAAPGGLAALSEVNLASAPAKAYKFGR